MNFLTSFFNIILIYLGNKNSNNSLKKKRQLISNLVISEKNQNLSMKRENRNLISSENLIFSLVDLEMKLLPSKKVILINLYFIVIFVLIGKYGEFQLKEENMVGFNFTYFSI